MSYNDWDYVNFSQKYELNYILKKYNLNQTEEKRNLLINLGKACKKLLGRTSTQAITHEEFYEYLDKYFKIK